MGETMINCDVEYCGFNEGKECKRDIKSIEECDFGERRKDAFKEMLAKIEGGEYIRQYQVYRCPVCYGRLCQFQKRCGTDDKICIEKFKEEADRALEHEKITYWEVVKNHILNELVEKG